jgi:hypothetical protein
MWCAFTAAAAAAELFSTGLFVFRGKHGGNGMGTSAALYPSSGSGCRGPTVA